jgi:hypothetical protein
LLTNPWFRSASNPNKPGLDGWTDAAGPNVYWSTSQKDSNPSPDSVQGTSARFAFGSGQGGGTGQGGVDAYLYQVVSADSMKQTLQFQTQWVTSWIEQATVTIYGGASPGGPWTSVWVPLLVIDSSGDDHYWSQPAVLQQTSIASGYSYYKVELHARYPEDRQIGAKFTGVYFAVSDADGSPNPTPTPDPGQTFADVPVSHPYYAEIEALYAAGYTGGCAESPLRYCPDQGMNRAESAVFVVRGVHGTDVEPSEPASSPFADLTGADWALKWANQMYSDGFSAGCGSDPLAYCPWTGHSRAEGAVFYLRMLNGVDYEPPPASGIFSDVTPGIWYEKWIEAAFDAGILPACGENPLQACPEAALDRGLAAYMLYQAKELGP